MRIHVIQNYNPPKLWNRGISIDYGMRNPTAVGFYATDGEGNVVKYDEYYETEMLVSEHAKNLKLKWMMEFGKARHLPIDIWIDPTTKDREGITGQSVWAEFSDNGVYASLANNDVRAGILKVAEYMRPRTDWKRPSWAIPLTEEHLKYAKTVGSPMFYVCERCHHTRQEIGEYQWKKLGTALTEKKDPEEKPRKKEDHSCDETRYYLMTQPDPTEMIAKIRPPATQTERVWLDLKRRTGKIDPRDIPPTHIMTPEQLGGREGFDGLD